LEKLAKLFITELTSGRVLTLLNQLNVHYF